MKRMFLSIFVVCAVATVSGQSHAGLFDKIADGFCNTFPRLCKDNDADQSGDELTFTKWTVADGLAGAAYNTVEDVDGDGLKDIVVTSFGKKLTMDGKINVYYNNGTGEFGESNWEKDKVFNLLTDYLCFPNEVNVEDIDGDGDQDLFAPSGFIPCAANPIYLGKWGLAWYEQTPKGWKRHDVVPYKNSNSHDFYHRAIFVDIDFDGIKDLLTVGEMKNTDGEVWAETVWFKGNTSADRFEKEARVIGQGGGGLPVIYDIDNDGEFEIFSAQYFGYLEDEVLGNVPASFVWFDMVAAPSAANPAGVWEKHIISDSAGPSIDFAIVENLLGDGQVGAIGANHTNFDLEPQWAPEALYSFQIPENSSDYWIEDIISDAFDCRDEENHGAPGLFAYGDIDDDGLIDIAVSGDGDPTIYLVKQTAPGIFETHVVDDGNVGQAGISMDDLNNDGRLEIIVSTYDDNAVYVYELND